MTEEDNEISEEARLKYPIGTKFICPYNKQEFVVKPNNSAWEILPNDNNNIDGGFGCGYLQHESKWAEITYSPIPKLTKDQKQKVLDLINEI